MTAPMVADLAAYRMSRQHPVSIACRWVSAVEAMAIANITATCALQRMWLRIWIGG